MTVFQYARVKGLAATTAQLIGEITTSASLRTLWRDAVGAVGATRNGARVYRSTTQTISNTTLTTISYDTVRSQGDDTFWAAGAPTRLTVTTDGLYAVGFCFEIAGGSDGRTRYADIQANGTTVIAEASGSGLGVTGNAADTVLLAGSVIRPFSAGDFVVVRVYQNSGGSLNLTAGDATSEHLNEVWIEQLR